MIVSLSSIFQGRDKTLKMFEKWTLENEGYQVIKVIMQPFEIKCHLSLTIDHLNLRSHDGNIKFNRLHLIQVLRVK